MESSTRMNLIDRLWVPQQLRMISKLQDNTDKHTADSASKFDSGLFVAVQEFVTLASLGVWLPKLLLLGYFRHHHRNGHG